VTSQLLLKDNVVAKIGKEFQVVTVSVE